MRFLNEDLWFALESRKKMSNWLSGVAHLFRCMSVSRPRYTRECVAFVSAGGVVGL